MSNMNDAQGLCMPYSKLNSSYETEFEPAINTVWAYLNPKGLPCYSLELLKAMIAHDKQLAENGGRIDFEGEMRKVDYYVTRSRTPGVFNLGGDLSLFVLLIKTGDREALAQYAKLCIDVQYPRTQSFFSPTLTSISLVEGDALGGGFECALASDVIVAEEGAQLGFPEILFNLFPGMGACSLLERRIGLRAAEELILSGKMLPARKLHEMGVIDVLAPNGQGESTLRSWIAANAKRRNGMQAMFRARQFVRPVTRQELDGIVELWVEAALRLGEREMKMMSRLARAQGRRMEHEQAAQTQEGLALLAEPLAMAG
ncbi:MAG TPA: crotonase/enoyl-CoA hydratase family protein [Burkholderiales bacterium]|nr:crotonase/enoyl-CoA hydratase family protein [Burkholderiales bacterium]